MERDKIKRLFAGMGAIALVLMTFYSYAYADDDMSMVSYRELTQLHVQRPSDISMAVDVVIARPLLLAATIIGSGLFLVSLPLSFLGGNAEEAANKLVITPGRATFFRCLGCSVLDDDEG